MKRFGTWLATHIPLVAAFLLLAGSGAAFSAAGDHLISNGLMVDSNAQVVTVPRLSTVAFLSGDKFLPNGLLLDANSQLVSTLRDSSGNALPPVGGACGVGAIAMGTLCTITGAPSNTCTPGALALRSDGAANTTLYVCTATNTWTAAVINGTATTATNATNLTTTDVTTNATYYPTFQTATGGTNPLITDSSHATYNPNSGTLKIRAMDFSALIGSNKALCTDSSSLSNNCVTALARPDFGALASTCSASLIVPCAFTWTCTMSSGNCTTTQAVPASSRCLLTPTVSPDLSATNVVSIWVTLVTTTATIHVSDMLGTSSAAFSGNGECL